MSLAALTFSYKDNLEPGESGSDSAFPAALIGLICYSLAGMVLWLLACDRFRAEKGPLPTPGSHTTNNVITLPKQPVEDVNQPIEVVEAMLVDFEEEAGDFLLKEPSGSTQQKPTRSGRPTASTLPEAILVLSRSDLAESAIDAEDDVVDALAADEPSSQEPFTDE